MTTDQTKQNVSKAIGVAIIRAAEDDQLRKEILADPRGVLEKQLGAPLPDGLKIEAREAKLIEPIEGGLRMLLPPRLPSAGQLSEEQLASVGGGSLLDNYLQAMEISQIMHELMRDIIDNFPKR